MKFYTVLQVKFLPGSHQIKLVAGWGGKIGEKLAWLAGQDQNSPIKRYR
jgi:hypothetical protein